MRSLLFLVLTLVVVGCSLSSHEVASSLDAAEALMQSDPDAAMARLNSYDISEFDDSATLARWALLYSEAMVIGNITAPTDTIVDIAVEYYGNHGLGDEFRRASRLKALLRATENHDALATALYLQKEKEFFLYRERMTRERYVYLGVVVLAIAGAVIVWQRQRLKRRKLETDQLMAESLSLRDGLLQNRREQSRLETALEAMLLTRFNTIDSLCQTFYESQGTKGERKAIAEKVRSQIEALKSDADVFAEMEHCVNECRGGLLDQLKKEWPTIKPDEYRLMVYLASNLSNRTIALLIGESIEVVYKRKSRLKAKVSSLDIADPAMFLSVF